MLGVVLRVDDQTPKTLSGQYVDKINWKIIRLLNSATNRQQVLLNLAELAILHNFEPPHELNDRRV